MKSRRISDCVCSIRKSRPESLRVLPDLNPNPKNRPWAEQETASEYMAVRMHIREEKLETVDLLPLKMDDNHWKNVLQFACDIVCNRQPPLLVRLVHQRIKIKFWLICLLKLATAKSSNWFWQFNLPNRTIIKFTFTEIFESDNIFLKESCSRFESSTWTLFQSFRSSKSNHRADWAL